MYSGENKQREQIRIKFRSGPLNKFCDVGVVQETVIRKKVLATEELLSLLVIFELASHSKILLEFPSNSPPHTPHTHPSQ
jgi:hypothetical protein